MMATRDAAQRPVSAATFPVVGIGTDADHLAALETLLQQIPNNTSMAFVVVMPLTDRRARGLVERLQSQTPLPVQFAQAGLTVQPNQLYLARPGWQLGLEQGVFQLTKPATPQERRTPIDRFLLALAATYTTNAIAILLAGVGKDGAMGLQAVKEQGGLTLVQLPTGSAQAIPPADLVASIADLGVRLLAVSTASPSADVPEDSEWPAEDVATLNAILAQLLAHTGQDFSYYKRSTLLRRIGRRMQAQHLAHLPQYVELLRQNAEENTLLVRECLVSVTNFFRDPDEFAALEKHIIPLLFADKKYSDTVRVWVIGCATGEEAYSVAMLLRERAAEIADAPHLQVFATDIDEEALAFARRGLYPHTIANQLSQARLQRFFVEEQDGYRIKLDLREVVLFAVHNVLKDPPFSKLDLISCRNVLIYFTREAQEKSFAVFHYALNAGSNGKGGYLFLGTSESTDAAVTLFTAVDKRHHLYQRHKNLGGTARRVSTTFTGVSSKPAEITTRPHSGSTRPKPRGVEELYQQWTLRKYAPPRVLINESYAITHVFNGAGRYLRDPEGEVTQNILQKVLPELRLYLRSALYQAFQKGERSTSRLIQAQRDGEDCFVQLHVGPVEEPGFPRDLIEVVFEERKEEIVINTSNLETLNNLAGSDLVTGLEEELLRTRERLQTVMEEHESSAQEMKASNEELQSINEELKSTSEELETSKEELQSMNEELVTVNHELKLKIEELSRTNSDLLNLISSTDVGVIFLDQGLYVKRFTPHATELFHLIETDLGRPFAHIAHRIRNVRPLEYAAQVLASLELTEEIVQSEDEHWYILRLFPYRTIDGTMDGVVLTFIDISDLKRAESEVQQRIQQQTVAELGRQALRNDDLPDLLTSATARLAQTLDVELCSIFALEGEAKAQTLQMVAGVGWSDEFLGPVAVTPYYNLPSWVALQNDEPVVVEDVEQQKQFQFAQQFRNQSMVSGISVVIGGSERPYGVLSAYSKTPRSFSGSDINFVQAVANLLGEAIARQQTESELRASEDRFRTLADAAPALVWVCAPDGGITYMNARWYEYTGQTPEEAAGYGWAVTMHPDDAAAILPYWQHCQQTGETYQGEVRYRRHDGLYRWHIFRALPQRDEVGAILAWYGSSVDVHDAKIAEQALRQQEEFVRQIADNVPGLIGYVSADERYRFVNATFEAWFQRPRQQITNGTVVDLIGGSERNRLTVYRQQALAGEPVSYETTFAYPDGVTRTVWGRYQPDFAADGRVLGFYLSVMDISERKQMEEALRESETRLTTILNNIPASIYLLSPDHRYLYVNRFYEQRNGITNAEIRGQSVYDRHSPEVAVHLVANEKQVLASKTAITFEETAPRLGETRFYTTIKAPLLDPTGQPYALLGISLDVTDRKVAEMALQASELRFRTLANAMPQLVWTADAEGYVDYYNRRIEDYDPAVRLAEGGFDWSRFVHPDDLAATFAAWQAAAVQGQPYTFEHRLRMQDNSWRWHLSLAMPGEKSQAQWYGTATDIHERKQMEDALRQSEERYRTLFETMDEGFCVIEMLFDAADQPLDYRFVEINPAFARFTGLENALGKTVRQLVPNLEQHWFDIYGAVALTGKARRFTEGSSAMGRWFDVYAFRISELALRQVAILFTDITERKQNEADLVFLADLAERIRLAENADQLLAEATDLVGQYLKIDRAFFSEQQTAQDRGLIQYQYSPILPPVAAEFRLSSYVTATIGELSAGRTLVNHDTQRDPRTQAIYTTVYAPEQEGAGVGVPLLRQGELVAIFSVTTAAPRQWQVREIRLLETVAERVWLAAEKLRLDEELRTRAERFRKLANAMPQIVLTSNAVGDLDFCNERWLTYTGRSAEDSYTHGVWPSIHPEDVAMDQERWATAVANCTLYQSEYRLRRHDGVYRWYLERAEPIYEENQLVAWYHAATDIDDHKQTEVALRQLYERFVLAETAMNGYIYSWDMQSGRTERSSGFSRLLGYADDEIVATNTWWRSLLHPDDLAGLRSVRENHAPDQEMFEMEYRARHRQGHYVWIWDRLRLLRDAAGQPIHAVGSGVDISERRRNQQNQQLLLDLHTELRDASDPATIAQAIVQRLGEYLDVSRCRFSRIDQATDQAILLASWRKEGEPPAHPRTQLSQAVTPAYIRHAQAGQTLVVADAQADARPLVTKQLFVERGVQALISVPCLRNGEWVASLHLLQTTPRRWRPDEVWLVEALINQFWPLLEKVQAEAQLRQSEERYRALFEHAGDAIFIAGDDGIYQDVNEAACQLSGYSREELIGKSIHDLTPPASYTRLDEDRQRLLAGQNQIDQWHLLCKDGSTIPIEVSVKQLPDGRWQAFVRDITERLRLEGELRQLNLELEQRVDERTAELARSNRELDQFAYVASHDLKAPLRAIDNLAQWIREDAAAVLPVASQTHFEKLRGRVKRMEKLLDDLLAFSRAGRVRTHPERVDTGALVRDVSEFIAPPPGFSITHSEPMPVVRTERVPLETILRNLIGNAIKHHHRPDGKIHVEAHETADLIEFTVTDDGPGIEPQYHQKIFELFQTLKPRDQVEGSGMGLAVVKKLVESYGGTISVESAPGQGSTFRFTWPK